MAFWEFLLQQEGDCDWLALEPPDVEVLEGRYCLTAQSHTSNTLIEVQVAFEDDQEKWFQLDLMSNDQKRVAQTRTWSHATDHNGVLLVLPFTYLKPGQWKVRCQIPNAEMGASELQDICLRVLATESNVKEPWSDLSLFAIEATYPMEEAKPFLTRLGMPSPLLAPLAVQLDNSELLEDEAPDPSSIDMYSDLFLSQAAEVPTADAALQVEDENTDDPDPTFIQYYGGEWVPEPLFEGIETVIPVAPSESEIKGLVKAVANLLGPVNDFEPAVLVETHDSQLERVEVLAIAPVREPALDSPSQVPWAGKLGLELFDLVKNPDFFQPVPFVPQSQWMEPPRLDQRTALDADDPWTGAIKLPILKTQNWSELDSTQVPIMATPLTETAHTPSAAAQVLSRLVQASQLDETRNPSFELVRGGRAASQKRFLAKLSDLLQPASHLG